LDCSSRDSPDAETSLNAQTPPELQTKEGKTLQNGFEKTKVMNIIKYLRIYKINF
jgi:hypothetical protein